ETAVIGGSGDPLLVRVGCGVAADLGDDLVDARTCAHLRAFSFHPARSEEHTSELQSRFELVCRLQLEKKIEFEKPIIIESVNRICQDTSAEKHSIFCM